MRSNLALTHPPELQTIPEDDGNAEPVATAASSMDWNGEDFNLYDYMPPPQNGVEDYDLLPDLNNLFDMASNAPYTQTAVGNVGLTAPTPTFDQGSAAMEPSSDAIGGMSYLPPDSGNNGSALSFSAPFNYGITNQYWPTGYPFSLGLDGLAVPTNGVGNAANVTALGLQNGGGNMPLNSSGFQGGLAAPTNGFGNAANMNAFDFQNGRANMPQNFGGFPVNFNGLQDSMAAPMNGFGNTANVNTFDLQNGGANMPLNSSGFQGGPANPTPPFANAGDMHSFNLGNGISNMPQDYGNFQGGPANLTPSFANAGDMYIFGRDPNGGSNVPQDYGSFQGGPPNPTPPFVNGATAGYPVAPWASQNGMATPTPPNFGFFGAPARFGPFAGQDIPANSTAAINNVAATARCMAPCTYSNGRATLSTPNFGVAGASSSAGRSSAPSPEPAPKRRKSKTTPSTTSGGAARASDPPRGPGRPRTRRSATDRPQVTTPPIVPKLEADDVPPEHRTGFERYGAHGQLVTPYLGPGLSQRTGQVSSETACAPHPSAGPPYVPPPQPSEGEPYVPPPPPPMQ